MRQTLTMLISAAQDAIGTTDSAIATYLKHRINERYGLVADKSKIFENTVDLTAPTVEDQQYYYNPRSLKSIETISITVGTSIYNLKPVNSAKEWNRLNFSTIRSNIGERFFRRKDSYGIWPIPADDDNTITVTYTQTAVPMAATDYTTGTVTVSQNSQTVTGSGSSWTANIKPGYWLTLTDTDGNPRGTWYRILTVGGNTTITLETFFEETGEAGAKYLIGETPELPEEAHQLLWQGAVSDFYTFKAKDIDSGTKYNNIFWTGAANVAPQFVKDNDLAGGLLGFIASMRDRDDNGRIVERNITRDLDVDTLLAWGDRITP